MPALGYYNADLTLIKQKCVIPSSSSSFDVQLTSSLREAFDYMNGILKRYTTLPLTTSDTLAEIEANIAAGMFKEEQTTPVEGERVKKHILRERGEAALAEYIKTNYEASGSRRSSFFKCSQKSSRMRIDAGPLGDDD
jgi:flagellar capping protein FliD